MAICSVKEADSARSVSDQRRAASACSPASSRARAFDQAAEASIPEDGGSGGVTEGEAAGGAGVCAFVSGFGAGGSGSGAAVSAPEGAAGSGTSSARAGAFSGGASEGRAALSGAISPGDDASAPAGASGELAWAAPEGARRKTNQYDTSASRITPHRIDRMVHGREGSRRGNRGVRGMCTSSRIDLGARGGSGSA